VKQEALSPNVHVERRSEMVELADVRAMLQLEGELGELPAGSDEQRRHALLGLSALVGAQVAIWGVFGKLVEDNGFLSAAIHLGWSGDRERDAYEEYLRESQATLPDPCIERVALAISAPVCTFIRPQLMSDRAWYRDEHVQRYRRGCSIDPFMHSVRVHRDAGYVISLHRPWGARPFTERERGLVDLFHRESRALAPRERGPRLSPALDKTLRALLRGLSEKEAAAELGLSPHTVHEYVKALYRRFGVTSRAGLFARLR